MHIWASLFFYIYKYTEHHSPADKGRAHTDSALHQFHTGIASLFITRRPHTHIFMPLFFSSLIRPLFFISRMKGNLFRNFCCFASDTLSHRRLIRTQSKSRVMRLQRERGWAPPTAAAAAMGETRSHNITKKQLRRKKIIERNDTVDARRKVIIIKEWRNSRPTMNVYVYQSA